MGSGEQERRLEYVDDLTGLHNRRYFREKLLAEKRKADKEGTSFALAMIDLDNFKPINDTHGHLTGDRVLARVGELLTESVRPSDILCRYAGDEFVVILPEIREEDLKGVAQRIKSSLGGASWTDERGESMQPVTCSLGYSFYTESGKNLDELVDWADQALYAVKRRGGNGFCGERDLPAESMGHPLVSTPYVVGREEELNHLTSLLKSVKEGGSRLVLIHGEAGVGKTLERNCGVALLGDCHEETRSIPYYPFREAFNRFFDEKKDAGFSLLSDLPEYSQRELARILPRLKEMKPSELERASDPFRLFEAVRLLLLQISERAQNSLLLVIEDLHWSDEASLDLFHYLVHNLKEASALLCGTYRTEEKEKEPRLVRFAGTLRRERLSDEVPLGPLSAEDVSTMIRLLCPGSKASQDYRDFLYRKTEGNPFFVEEMLKYLSSEGVDSCPPEVREVPLSIYAVLQRRMDALAPGMKEVFACAALIGEEFEFEVLSNVQGRRQEDLLDVVEAGVRAHIIRENLEGEGGHYRFVHSLMADILYSNIGKVRRKLWHRQVGEALEETYSGRLELLNGRLVYHYERAEEWEKALTCAVRSAGQAKEDYANQEAIQLYQKAKRVLQRLPRDTKKDAVSIAMELGDTYEIVGEYRKALEEYQLASNLASDESDEKKQAEALSRISEVYRTEASFDEAMTYIEKSRQIYERIGDQRGVTACLSAIGAIRAGQGDYEEALKYHEMALAIRREAGDKGGVADSLENIGTISWSRGDYPDALGHIKKALHLRRETGDRIGVAESLNMIGNIHWSLGDYDEALKSHEETLRIRREIGFKRGVGGSLTNIGNVYWGKGDYGEALRFHEESLVLNRETGSRRGILACLTNIGNILSVRGDYAGALRYHEEALEISREIGDKMNVAMSLVNIGDTRLLRGEFGDAFSSYRESLVTNREMGDKDGTAFDLWGIGNTYQGIFEIGRAMEYHAEALSLFDEMGMKTEKIGVLASIGVDCHLLGEDEKALEHLNRAREMLTQYGTTEAGPELLTALAEFHLDNDDSEKTREYCEELLSIAEKENLNRYLAIIGRIKAELLRREVVAGKLAKESLTDAERLLNEARAMAEKSAALPLLWKVCLSLGWLYETRGDDEKAREAFKDARDVIRDIASKIGDEKLKESFLNSRQVQEMSKSPEL